ncbi:MAG TPA: hypothetical protein VK154_15285, partial [Chitinophagales bacterium]|nr:hypothetical protein [Chitinophagales bacterium]
MKNIHFFLVLLCITLTGYRAAAQCDSLIGTTQIMNGLPNGTYKVVVTGANGCTAEAFREISTYNDLYVTVYNNQDNSCNTS